MKLWDLLFKVTVYCVKIETLHILIYTSSKIYNMYTTIQLKIERKSMYHYLNQNFIYNCQIMLKFTKSRCSAPGVHLNPVSIIEFYDQERRDQQTHLTFFSKMAGNKPGVSQDFNFWAIPREVYIQLHY